VQNRKSTAIRRQQIVDIIRSIISSRGIEHVTISEIAKKLELPRGQSIGILRAKEIY